MFSKIFPRTYT